MTHSYHHYKQFRPIVPNTWLKSHSNLCSLETYKCNPVAASVSHSKPVNSLASIQTVSSVFCLGINHLNVSVECRQQVDLSNEYKEALYWCSGSWGKDMEKKSIFFVFLGSFLLPEINKYKKKNKQTNKQTPKKKKKNARPTLLGRSVCP